MSPMPFSIESRRCDVEPRERLKRYLEQRRELGERELMLDGMTVEDVMRIVGAAGSGSGPRANAASGDGDRGRPTQDEPRRAAPAEPTTDWREALRASGVDPAPGERQPRKAAREPQSASEIPTGAPVAKSPPARPDDLPPAAIPVSKRYEFPRPDDARPAPAHAPERVPPAVTGDRDRSVGTDDAPIPHAPATPPGLIVGTAARDLFAVGDAKAPSLDEIAATIRVCTKCRLYATATNPVPGEGDPAAELVCVGEAPGANEDATGRPFVGQAGQLLTKILAAISLRREDVFICNVLKHRPPGNRNPLPDEVAACSPYLVQQLEAIRPKVIVAFGTFAAQTLLNTKLPIGRLRGSVHRYYGIPLIVTYHPAALLRNPAWKRPTWEDVQLARRILDTAPRA